MLVSQIFGLGHLVLFSHTPCEHGALVHTIRRGGEPSVRAGLLREPGVYAADGTNDGSDHEHCDPFATPSALASVTLPSAEAPLVGVASEIRLPVREAERAVAVLSLAPKTSPTV
jgi:hypothetical protein